jgi:hypothetical protein
MKKELNESTELFCRERNTGHEISEATEPGDDLKGIKYE